MVAALSKRSDSMNDMSDLFTGGAKPTDDGYSAKDIKVLEGLEPVRQRPGMYIGGTDERALHHLVAEVLDNSMDEAVAGHASRIEITLQADGICVIDDNGRGIPVDPHPKFRDKSALEVILTTLHAGGKFEQGAYATAGGLHGVGVSVVNALSDEMTVEVARERRLWKQSFRRGKPAGPLEDLGPVQNRRGTRVIFHPDAEIFGDKASLKPGRIYKMARSKAYLYPGVEIRWKTDPVLIHDETPAEAVLHFPGGLADYLTDSLGEQATVSPTPFAGRVDFPDGKGRVEWAVQWLEWGDGWATSYCNTIPTPQGGSHENGFRSAISRGLKAYGELTSNKKAAQITADDALGGATGLTPDGRPQLSYSGGRAAVAATWWHAGRTRKLLTAGSGVSMSGGPTRDLGAELRQIWLGWGVPTEAIEIHPGPRNTREEMALLARLQHERGWQRIGVVTSASTRPGWSSVPRWWIEVMQNERA